MPPLAAAPRVFFAARNGRFRQRAIFQGEEIYAANILASHALSALFHRRISTSASKMMTMRLSS